MDRRIISEYSAGAFAFAIEEAVLEGFTLSGESQFYPCVNGFVYEAIMFKRDTEATPLVDFSNIVTEPNKTQRKGTRNAN